MALSFNHSLYFYFACATYCAVVWPFLGLLYHFYGLLLFDCFWTCIVFLEVIDSNSFVFVSKGVGFYLFVFLESFCVCFLPLSPHKSDYRKLKLKSLVNKLKWPFFYFERPVLKAFLFFEGKKVDWNAALSLYFHQSCANPGGAENLQGSWKMNEYGLEKMSIS